MNRKRKMLIFDRSAPVISSCNIHTIPIGEAQSMFPPPRPPSPTSRARAQKARLAANPEMLNAKDASMLLNMQRFQGGIVQPVNSPPQSPAHVLQGLRPKKSVHRQMPEPLRSPPSKLVYISSLGWILVRSINIFFLFLTRFSGVQADHVRSNPFELDQL